MKIIQITPGSGGNFYCENCLRDAILVQAWRALGHDAVVVPLYLPLDMDKAFSVAPNKIYFGGINVYLQQKFALFRKLPSWLDRLFDSPVLLRMAAKRAGMVDARQLAETTISILQGNHGRQVKELNRLVNFLAQNQTPDIICLSNIMLSGLAESIKQKLHVPVVSLLQDEDEFLDIMPEPWHSQAWDVLRDNIRHIDCCIAVSQYYANFMAPRLKLGDDKLKVCYVGIAQPAGTISDTPDNISGNMLSKTKKEITNFPPSASAFAVAADKPVPAAVPVIGYLSRMCPEKGLDILVDAFITLKKHPALHLLKLRIAGGHTKDDEPFIRQVTQKLELAGYLKDVEFISAFDAEVRSGFFRSITLLSVPEKRGPACAMYALEALAYAVPIVQPPVGVFNELYDMIGPAVRLAASPAASDLAQAMYPLLTDTTLAQRLGLDGRNMVQKNFNVDISACRMINIFRDIL